jgi:selenide,water dikinase
MTVHINWADVPLLPNVSALLKDGNLTGASGRNWEGYGHEISLASDLPAECQPLLSDPQTSGGLLVSCAPDAVADVLAVFQRHGFKDAAVVGHMGEAQSSRLMVS